MSRVLWWVWQTTQETNHPRGRGPGNPRWDGELGASIWWAEGPGPHTGQRRAAARPGSLALHTLQRGTALPATSLPPPGWKSKTAHSRVSPRTTGDPGSASFAPQSWSLSEGLGPLQLSTLRAHIPGVSVTRVLRAPQPPPGLRRGILSRDNPLLKAAQPGRSSAQGTGREGGRRQVTGGGSSPTPQPCAPGAFLPAPAPDVNCHSHRCQWSEPSLPCQTGGQEHTAVLTAGAHYSATRNEILIRATTWRKREDVLSERS